MKLYNLRQAIFESVTSIDDEEFLGAVKVILDSKSVSTEYKLNALQTERVALVNNQHDLGDTMLHDELLIEIDQWLRTK